MSCSLAFQTLPKMPKKIEKKKMMSKKKKIEIFKQNRKEGITRAKNKEEEPVKQ